MDPYEIEAVYAIVTQLAGASTPLYDAIAGADQHQTTLGVIE